MSDFAFVCFFIAEYDLLKTLYKPLHHVEKSKRTIANRCVCYPFFHLTNPLPPLFYKHPK